MKKISDLDKESLIETIDILSDTETMRGIAKGVEDFKKGKWKTLEIVEKDTKKVRSFHS